MRHLRRCWCTL